MSSYDFVTAVKIGKNDWLFFGPLRWSVALFWRFSGLYLAPRQKEDLAILEQ